MVGMWRISGFAVYCLAGFILFIFISGLLTVGNSYGHTMRPVLQPDTVSYSNIIEVDRIGDQVIATVLIREMLLFEALTILARKAGLGISYSSEIYSEIKVSASFDKVPFHYALYGLLNNTGYEAILSSTRDVLVIRKANNFAMQDRPLSEAPTGILSGIILDAGRKESLPGTNVIIRGTRLGTSTDIDGRFIIRNVPEGPYTINVSFMGFKSKEHKVFVSGGKRTHLELELEPDFLEGDEILVQAVQRGQARALTIQRQSVNILNVISSEQMDRFADETVDGLLRRISGMGHEGSGVNIRGIGAGMSNVRMDGQRMGTTGAGRSIDLSTISADMVQQLEVIKVVTPDMDADALAGFVNINTRRPVGGARTLNIRVGGGAQPRYVGHAGPQTRISFSYGDAPQQDFSYAFNFSFQRHPDAVESIRYSWDQTNIRPWGPIDVLGGLDSRYEFGTRDRYGIGGQFTYQPTSRSTYHMQGTFNFQDRSHQRHEWNQRPRIENMVTPYQTGPVSSSLYSTFGYSAGDTQTDTYQYTVQAGGRHRFDTFDIQYKIGWGHGRRYRNAYGYDWSSGYPGWDVLIDIEDRWHPIIDIAPWGPISLYPNSEQLPARGATPDHSVSLHRDNEVSTGLDLEREHRFGKLKFGGSTVSIFQEGESQRFYMMYDGRTGPLDFPQLLNNQWNVFGRQHNTYTIPFMIDVDDARMAYYARYPNLRKDYTRFALRQTDWYGGQEHILAAYAMTELKFGFLTVLSGLRIEHTLAEYEGREGLFRDGQSRGVQNTRATTDYTHFFPNAQLLFHLGPRTNYRLAYSRTIGRPNFNLLVPYRDWNFDRESVSYGNPDLKPMVSENLDMLIEHYFMNVGQISAGIFYKKLNDFVFTVSDRISIDGLQDLDPPAGYSPEQFAFWDRRTFLNGEEATVYGFEFSWQQHLSFLPGFLGNFGTYVNYSYTYSKADIGRKDKYSQLKFVRIEDQRPHVVNAGLGYSHGRFSGQVSYHWSNPAVLSYASTSRYSPTFREERVYFDSYYDSARDLSITLRYRLTDSFRIWLDGSNMLNQRSVSYEVDRRYYPRTMSLSGRRLNFGLRYTL
jgi:TonB-dependent receptor